MRSIRLVIFLGVATPMAAMAQDAAPRRNIGVYGGADISATEPADYRIGVHYAARLAGPVEIYPAFDVIFNGRADSWQAVVALRVRPLGNTGVRSVWYVGGGAVVRDSGTRKAVLTGIDVPFRRALVFSELRFHGPIERGDGQLELLLGIGLSYR